MRPGHPIGAELERTTLPSLITAKLCKKSGADCLAAASPLVTRGLSGRKVQLRIPPETLEDVMLLGLGQVRGEGAAAALLEACGDCEDLVLPERQRRLALPGPSRIELPPSGP